MPQLQFFAMESDIRAVCESFENKFAACYVPIFHQTSPTFSRYSNSAAIPNLGHANQESSIINTAYLILAADAQLNIESVDIGGVRKFRVNEGINPEGFELLPAGMFDEKTIILGRVATMGLTDVALKRYRAFAAILKRSFTRVNGLYVGAEAGARWAEGWRLTAAIQSPPEFDLSPE